MVDPNVYALSISIELDAVRAFSTLDEFGQKATEIEEKVSTAAQNSIDSLSNIASTLNDKLTEAAGVTKTFTASSTELETILSKATDSIKEAYDVQTDSLDDIEKRLKFLQKIEDIQEKLEDSLENEHDTGEEYLKLIDRWIKALESKNLVHQQEGDLVESEVDLLDMMNSQAESLEANFQSSANVLDRIRSSLGNIWALIKLFDSETENFVTANYRAYGSQQQLLNQTRHLSAELGVTRESAIAAYKSLADVKTPAHEIDRLAKTVAIANRTTGVSTDSIASYTRNLRNMGLSVEQTQRQILFLTDAMRKYGLTQHDINVLTNESALTTLRLGEMFGGTADSAKKMEEARVILAAMGKQLNLSADGANQFFNWLTSDVSAMSRFSSLAGVAINNADDFQKAQIKAGLAVEQQMAQLKAAGASEAELIARRQVLIDVYFGGNEAAFRMTQQLGKEAKQLGITGDAVGDYAKLIGKLREDQLDPWNKANDSLTAQLRLLKNEIVGFIGPAIQYIADSIKEVLKWVSTFARDAISAISTFIEWIQSAIAWMERWIPGFSSLMYAVKILTGLLAGFVLVVATVGVALAAFGTAFASSAALVRGTLNVIRTIGRAIIEIAKAIGEAVRVILTSIGQGLAALGRSIQPVILQLLGLGVVVLLIGAGFYLMGLGLSYAAEQGWMAVAMLLAMTVAMVIMIVTLAIVATVAGPVIPLMLALAVVILILGAATMLAGIGMYFIGTAVQALAMYGLAAAAALPALAKGIFWLGMAGAAGMAGILALAASLWVLVIPVLLLGVGFYLLATAIQMISVESLAAVAQGMLDASTILISASWNLLVAGIYTIIAGALLFAGSAMLIAAAPMLLAAATAMIPAGIMLKVGAKFLSAGANALVDAANTIYYTGTRIGVGGVAMLRGMVAISAAASMMVSVGAKLYMSADNLEAGAKAIYPLASVIYTAGMSLLYGGMGLYYGAIYIYYSALWIEAGAQMLITAAGTLASGADQLITDGLLMMVAGIYIWISGIIIQLASVELYWGAVILMIAAEQLDAATYMLYMAGMWLVPAAISIYVGMMWLESATTRFVRTVSKIDKMGKAMHLLASSFDILSRAPINALGNAAVEALLAIPLVDALAIGLENSATLFQRAADKFVTPVNSIAAALGNLSLAMATLGGQGLTVQKDMDKLEAMLDHYSQLLEGTAMRIETAVVAKAVPAMDAAEEAGIAKAVRSEAITTVKVMNNREGQAEQADESARLATQQIALLQAINDKLDIIQAGGSELNTIVELLETYLPDVGGKDHGLTTEFNQWMK